MSPLAQGYYPTNLTDGQWPRLEPWLPKPKSGPGKPGRPPVDRRRVVNGILSVDKTGGPWRLLPNEVGCWPTGYDYVNRWSRAGLWRQAMEA
jgi:transposase